MVVLLANCIPKNIKNLLDAQKEKNQLNESNIRNSWKHKKNCWMYITNKKMAG